MARQNLQLPPLFFAMVFIASGYSPHAYAQAEKIFLASPDRLQAAPELTTDRMIVKLRSLQPAFMVRDISADKMHNLNATVGIEMKLVRQMTGGAHILKLPESVTHMQAEAHAQVLRSHPDVEYAEPDRRYTAEATASDPLYVGALYTITPVNSPAYSFRAQQWHLNDPVGGINAPAAWDISTGNPNLNIAVVDSGKTIHPDLNGRFAGGFDFIGTDGAASTFLKANDGNGRDNNADDPGDWINATDILNPVFSKCKVERSAWHGTAIAGIIGATANNNLYGTGINWNSRLVPIRVLGKCGSYTSDVLDAVTYAAGIDVPGVPTNQYPAKVINLSLGGPGACAQFEQSVYDAVSARGVVVIGSAGNTNIDVSGHSPAGSCRNIIAVAATGQKGQRASYSNFGSNITISAPGGVFEDAITPQGGLLHLTNNGTTSPTSDDFAWGTGTSFAAPVVSGVVSLMLSINPNLTPAQVTNILQTTARRFPLVPTNMIQCNTGICGAGIVDAKAAVAEANRLSMNPITPMPSPISTSGGGGGCSLSSSNDPTDITLTLMLGLALLWRTRRLPGKLPLPSE